MSGDPPSTRDPVMYAGIAGLAGGALVGLVFFGGLEFVPALLTLVGGAAGVMIGGRQAGLDYTLSELLVLVFAAEDPRAEVQRREAERVTYSGASGARAARAPSRPRPVVRAKRVPRPVGPPPPLPAGRSPIDLNSADVEQLGELPGVHPAAAARIVAHRTAFGPYRSVDALAEVWGFDDEIIAYLEAWATVSAGDPAVPA